MQETIAQISNQVTEKWGSLSKENKKKIGIGVSAFVIAIVVLAFILSKPKMKVLYRNLDVKAAAEVTSVLDTEKINYTLSDNGTTILLEQKDINSAQLILARENVPKGRYTFDDALSNTMSTTENEKKAKMHYLKENDLEATLESMDSIEKADVTLVIPEEKNSFLESKQKSSASVLLTLSEPLSTKSIEGIARLICSSVENLEMDSINIVDSTGNNLYIGQEEDSLSLSKQQEHKQAAEKLIHTKIENLLSGLYDDVRISPNLVLDFEQYEEVKEEYSPQFEDDPRGIIQKEVVSSSSSTNTTDAQAPGVATNGNPITYQAGEGVQGESETDNKDITYVNNKVTSNKTKNVGDIVFAKSSLAVNLFKNKVYVQEDVERTLAGQSWEEFKQANSMQNSIPVEESIVESIKKATGIENVIVQGFEKPIFVDKEPYIFNYKDYLPFVLILSILIIIVVAILKFKKHDNDVEVEPELEVEEMLKVTKEQVELEEIELKENLETKKQIEKFADEKPEAVANLLRNWLTDEDWG